jgi:hypothetical protein
MTLSIPVQIAAEDAVLLHQGPLRIHAGRNSCPGNAQSLLARLSELAVERHRPRKQLCIDFPL